MTDPKYYKGRPSEFDIFEGYVMYKVAPFLQGTQEAIWTEAENLDGTENSLTRLENKVIRLGRNCAIRTAVSAANVIKRCQLGDDSDILYADAYILAYFSLLEELRKTPKTFEKIFGKWKAEFRNDINYLILSPNREIEYLIKEIWQKLGDNALSFDLDNLHESYMGYVARFSKFRVRTGWRPMNPNSPLSELSAGETERLEFDMGAKNFPFLTYWSQTLRGVRERAATKSVFFWGE